MKVKKKYNILLEVVEEDYNYYYGLDHILLMMIQNVDVVVAVVDNLAHIHVEHNDEYSGFSQKKMGKSIASFSNFSFFFYI